MALHIRGIALRGAMAGVALLMPTLHSNDGVSLQYSAAIAQAPALPQAEAFEAAKALGTVEAWDAFLSNYPTGFHADLARAYVKKLADPSTTPAAVANDAPARELPCSDAGKVRSNTSDEATKIRFVNDSGATLIIQWIDFAGALKEYGQLQPGAELTQDTFVSHPWIAAYQEGSCRQLFLPSKSASTARLVPEAQLKAARAEEPGDHGPTPEQTCKNSGMSYDGAKCVALEKQPAQNSKATAERRAKAACVDIGMIYLNGKCAPKTKAERANAEKKKNKACPAGMYRNPYGQCQPNETGG